MKGGKEHRVPLSPAALDILEAMNNIRTGAYVFPGARPGLPLGDKLMRGLLARMDRSGATVHGFRSAFRDWAAEQTRFPREVAELALAHTVEGTVERAYWRGDLLERRRQLMDEWARFCATPAPRGEVVPLWPT
jgi:integrase